MSTARSTSSNSRGRAPAALSRQARASLAALLVATGAVMLSATAPVPQEPQPPRFRAGVSRVSITVTVRDRRGRLVTGLESGDFVVIDSGTEKPVTDFEVREGGISLAAVLDASGSMAIGGRLQLGIDALHTLFSTLGEADEAALFAFDSAMRELHPFTRNRSDLRAALRQVRPFGSTSLHDALAEAARAVTSRGHGRGAVLIVTDGIDTSSALSPLEASAIASSVNVPIYVIGLDPSSTGATSRDQCVASGTGAPREELPCLAQWTGGAFTMARAADGAQEAVQRMIAELRHQYVLAFEASTEPGWHAIDVKARGDRLLTRTRTWYWVSGVRS